MLKINRLAKYLGLGTVNEVLALNILALATPPGKIVYIINSNDANKSIFLENISGAYLLNHRQIALAEESIIFQLEHQRDKFIGQVFQDPPSEIYISMDTKEKLPLTAFRGQGRKLTKGVWHQDRDKYRTIFSSLDLDLKTRLINSDKFFIQRLAPVSDPTYGHTTSQPPLLFSGRIHRSSGP
ncbi:MAG: hypothetical protein AMR96_00720 [Candidatus Adiutrix intracellularis]|jgi:ABC-type uncharacterized transport system ATPase component|nr:MAG: hypothetical protein AMR96_00720 [Candidatus Adiutrix intracellularis]MDR2827241.1 hypothetical protein [Candidatus Adiutrix intracellularis]